MAAGHAGRLKDDLLEHFPPPVFMDIDSIPVAVRWGQAIEDAIRSSAVVLVLIAKDWMRPQQAERGADDSQSGLRLVPGESRLDDPGDYVRREIETALRYNVPLIPVLIDRTEPPPLDKLPESVRALFDIEAVDLELKRWDDDFSNVLEAVERFVPPPLLRANLLVRGPLAVSVPLVILAVNYLGGYAAHSAAWIVLIAVAALAALAAASEYKRSRIWAAALVGNCLWFILFAINKTTIQQHLPVAHWKVIAGVTLAGVVLNVLFFIPALRSALSNKRSVHPLLPVFLGLMAAGLGIATYARTPEHRNLFQGAALVLFAAVVVDLFAPVLALARRSSERSAADTVGRSSPSPGQAPRRAGITNSDK